MRQIRIYQAGTYQQGALIDLSPEASQHTALVLRMQVGEPLILFCGDNQEYSAQIEAIKKRQVSVRILGVLEKNRESPLNLHLAQALSKGERMEWVLQKSVELGVRQISPLITERCVVRLDKERMSKKLNQWRSIVLAACEQSGRNWIPEVKAPLSLEDYLKEPHSGLKLILHPEVQTSWRDYALAESEITLMVGPEGGFSDPELALALKQGFQALRLGPRILRTETAAITALGILQAVAGDL